MSVSVYKAYYTRLTPPDHVALFVLTEPCSRSSDADSKAGQGRLFHVVDDSSRSTRNIVAMKQEERKNYVPNGSPSLHTLELVGTVSSTNVKDLIRICQNMPAPKYPRLPKDRKSRPPKCNAWLDNVIYDLHGKGVVQVSPTFGLPQKKTSLVIAHKTDGSSSNKASSSIERGESSNHTSTNTQRSATEKVSNQKRKK